MAIRGAVWVQGQAIDEIANGRSKLDKFFGNTNLMEGAKAYYTANEGKIKLKCPAVLHPSSLQGWDDGGRSCGFEELCVACVVSTKGKGRKL